MIIANALDFSFRNILAHPFRTLLTMVGVILGVSSLVAMSAMIKGMENGMKESLIAMGGLDKVIIDDDGVPSSMDHLSDLAPGKTFNDVNALKSSSALLKYISPEIREYRAYASYGGKRTRASEFVGVTPSVLEMNLLEVKHGRFFNSLDDEQALSVCVIGTGIRDRLFGKPLDPDYGKIPIGEWITINGQPFVIIGMFKHFESDKDRRMREIALKNKANKSEEQSGPARQKGWSGSQTYGNAFWRKNNLVYIPINTMRLKFTRYLDTEEGEPLIPDNRLDDIDIKVSSLALFDKAIQQSKNILGITHKGILDYEFETKQSSIDSINKRIRNSRISGSIIAGLSLLIGGIGIMNIMFASIQERIREIGTCKALGATALDVFVQVITESVIVCLLGAAAGIGVSFGVVGMLIWLAPSQNTPVITPEATIQACVFSVVVGILAGLFPALKAAKMSPIAALKY